MTKAPEAVIFDMDGVLIDSEHLWRRSMIKCFAEAGMPITEEQCRSTMGLRINEVIMHWRNNLNKKEVDPVLLEERILHNLLKLIEAEGRFIAGIPELVTFCRKRKLKIGVATSSSQLLMRAVLKKLELSHLVDAAVSAEGLTYGKPHPKVFLLCAKRLQVQHKKCLVIEDSVNGMIAAKAAQMQVMVVPEKQEEKHLFNLADHCCRDMREVLAILRKMFNAKKSVARPAS